ncbi:MAG: hypothetical protein ACYC4R_12905 [Anaerolineae bacterium]
MRTRNILLAVLAGLLIVSMSTVLLVSAQEPTETPIAPADGTDESMPCGRLGRGFGAMMGAMGARWGGESLIDVVADTLGVEADEIRADLQTGKTLREIIKERGGDPDAVIDAYAASQRAAIEEWLDSGDLEDWVNERLDAPSGAGRMGWHRMGGDSLVSTAAEVLGVETSDLIADLQDGQTLREAIEARGGDPEAVVDVYVAARQAALDEMVADGKITEEEAATLLEQVEEHANERLDSSTIGNGMFPRGMGSGRHMGRLLGQSG